MTKKAVLSALALMTVTALPAAAGGLAEPRVEPLAFPPVIVPQVVAAPAPAFSFNGPSVGLRLGYADVGTNIGASDEGLLLGVTANYDVDLGSVIAGVGVDYDALDISLGAVDVEAVARIRGRIGIDAGRSFYYVTGGYAKAFTDGGGLGDSDGAFAGIGGEVFLTDRVTAGAEILYHEFNDFNGGVDVDATTANVSLNLRF